MEGSLSRVLLFVVTQLKNNHILISFSILLNYNYKIIDFIDQFIFNRAYTVMCRPALDCSS